MHVGVAPIALILLGPPALPSDGGAATVEDPAPAEGDEELEDDPSWDAEEDAGVDGEPPVGEPEAQPVAPAPAEPSLPSPSSPPSSPAVTPSTGAVTPAAAPEPTSAQTGAAPGGASAQEQTTSQPEGPENAPAETSDKPEKPEKKKFPFKFFRIGVQGKLMYTHGTSDKNGLFDRDKSIEDSIENGMVTMSGAGDLGETQFGGFAGGFLVDLELFGINAWFDFHKFFTPGGMWSLLAGYDHDFSFAKDRLNLNIGLGFGLQKVFLGPALSELYYDEDNPESVNIGTTGIEMRAMVGLDIKIVGPLYTGPALFGGYHYLWTANSAEVTVEKGLHYSAGWNLSLRFALPP